MFKIIIGYHLNGKWTTESIEWEHLKFTVNNALNNGATNFFVKGIE